VRLRERADRLRRASVARLRDRSGERLWQARHIDLRAASGFEVVDAMRAYAANPAHPDVSALDMRFHEVLVSLSRSPRLTLMHGTLLTQVRLCLAWMQGSYDTVEVRVSEHSCIAQAILAGDADLADRLLVEHMDDGLWRVLTMVQGG